MEITKNNKKALLLGATGLVGGALLNILLESPHYRKVCTINRKDISVNHPKHDPIQIDFEEISSVADAFKVHDVFCCLGTTIGKAGSKEAFRKVDYDYVYRAACLASENKVAQFMLVTSVGADRNSLFFYSRVKGEIEEAVIDLGFWATRIFRPSLLLGDRDESRPVEFIARKIGAGLTPVIGHLLGPYRPVSDLEVAESMHEAAQTMTQGVHIYDSEHIIKLLE